MLYGTIGVPQLDITQQGMQTSPDLTDDEFAALQQQRKAAAALQQQKLQAANLQFWLWVGGASILGVLGVAWLYPKALGFGRSVMGRRRKATGGRRKATGRRRKVARRRRKVAGRSRRRPAKRRRRR